MSTDRLERNHLVISYRDKKESFVLDATIANSCVSRKQITLEFNIKVKKIREDTKRMVG